MVKHITSMIGISEKDLNAFFNTTKDLKDGLRRGQRPSLLTNKTLATVWERPSLRTRASFEVAMTQLGGHAMILKAYPKESADIIFKEDVRDQASVLSSMCDVIMARTYSHSTIEALSKYSTVPVINGMSDEAHPVQIMTDLYTILEKKGKLKGLKLAYMGEGRGNTAQDMIIGCALVGMNFTLGCPDYGKESLITNLGFGLPADRFYSAAKDAAKVSGSSLVIEHDPTKAVENADVVYTDTWIAFDVPEEKAAQENIKKIFMPYQVNKELLKHAKKDVIVMHCLPAYRGNEITADIFDDPRCAIYQQAENRLHVEKGILVELLKEGR